MNGMADALSCQEKDVPANDKDERVQSRFFQLLKPARSPHKDKTPVCLMAARIPGGRSHQNEPAVKGLEEERSRAIEGDSAYCQALEAVKTKQRKFPPELKLKTSASECDITHGKLHYRERKWVPNSEELRVRLISKPMTAC